MHRPLCMLLIAVMAAAVGCTPTVENSSQVVAKPIVQPVIHPVFRTPVSGQASARPAIQVDLKDVTEDFFFTAELYLSVQSSRFPGDTRVILPLNVGDFAGCRTQYVQLPFEVQEGDTLLFNLLDNDELSEDQERLLVDGCRLTGYCLLAGGEIYCPDAASLAAPTVESAAELLGEAIVADFRLQHFQHYGAAEYIAPAILPRHPHQANELSIRNESNYVPAVLKLYGPPEELDHPGGRPATST